MAVDFHRLDVFEVQIHREGGLEMVAAIELVVGRLRTGGRRWLQPRTWSAVQQAQLALVGAEDLP